jgi:hypothetical protein
VIDGGGRVGGSFSSDVPTDARELTSSCDPFPASTFRFRKAICGISGGFSGSSSFRGIIFSSLTQSGIGTGDCLPSGHDATQDEFEALRLSSSPSFSSSISLSSVESFPCFSNPESRHSSARTSKNGSLISSNDLSASFDGSLTSSNDSSDGFLTSAGSFLSSSDDFLSVMSVLIREGCQHNRFSIRE